MTCFYERSKRLGHALKWRADAIFACPCALCLKATEKCVVGNRPEEPEVVERWLVGLGKAAS